MSPFTVPLKAIRQPAFLYGCDGAILDANDLAESLGGRPLIGCTAADIIGIFGNRHPDCSPLSLEELPACRALAGEEVTELPYTVTLADGRTIDVLASASPIRVRDAIVGVLVVWQEIPDRKRAEEEQRRLLRTIGEQRGQLEATIDAMPIGLWFADATGRMTFINDAAREIWGGGDRCGLRPVPGVVA